MPSATVCRNWSRIGNVTQMLDCLTGGGAARGSGTLGRRRALCRSRALAGAVVAPRATTCRQHDDASGRQGHEPSLELHHGFALLRELGLPDPRRRPIPCHRSGGMLPIGKSITSRNRLPTLAHPPCRVNPFATASCRSGIRSDGPLSARWLRSWRRRSDRDFVHAHRPALSPAARHRNGKAQRLDGVVRPRRWRSTLGQVGEERLELAPVRHLEPVREVLVQVDLDSELGACRQPASSARRRRRPCLVRRRPRSGCRSPMPSGGPSRPPRAPRRGNAAS